MSTSSALSQLIYPGASVLIFAGSLKAFDQLRREKQIAILGLSMVELVVGIAVFVGVMQLFAAILQTLLYFSFTIWISFRIINNKGPCNCFGVLQTKNPRWLNVCIDLGLALATVIAMLGGLTSINAFGLLLSVATLILIYKLEIN